ncbi:MAG: HemK2/MTQ2 family protein methyltransferase [Nanoarchaeota archaeon]|nr:HemK2/MTQ2 family protein methyltransferase [Nanoarchaeota archaeon]
MEDSIYQPEEDSFLIQKYVKKYAKGIVLDIGTGSGILAEYAASSKKVVKVFGIDINEEAIKHCIRNQKSKKIIFAMSNLFNLFKMDERYKKIKFDTILFNPPYLPTDPKYKDAALDGGKDGYNLICKFLHESKKFLRPKGKILLIFSSLTGKEKLDNFLIKNYWNYTELDKIHIFFEDIFLYSIEVIPK